jgi:3-oxoacyl-[acyl-carrier-protein] synthase II
MRRVAITGVGCICALGDGRRSLWEHAARGCSGIGPITHFDARTFEVRLAAEVKTHPIVPDTCRSAALEDPKIGFALHAAGQALQDAGVTRLPPRALIHAGTSLEYFDPCKILLEGSADFASAVDASLRSGARPFQVPLDTAVRCLAACYGTPAQSLTNVSACAASTQAIGHAFRRVRDGSFDFALCGGFDSMLNPFGVGGFQLLGALSTDNVRGARACRPFDSARAGTVLGEGAAFLVLEPLDDAVARGRRVYGEILGYGSSLDAYKLSAPDTDGTGARAAMTRAVADAGLQPSDVDAVSAHATGTLLNDEVEAGAIRRVLGTGWLRVPVLATKSLVGHLIGAAGAVETIACLQGFGENRLHPNGSLERVATGCELDHVVGTPRPFGGRVILKNSFGFGGQNASLVLGRFQDAVATHR